MTWTTILSHFSALSAFLPVLIGLITTWVATKLIPYLTALAAKAEAELTDAKATSGQKFLAFLGDIAVKVSASVVQVNLPDLMAKLQSGALDTPAAMKAELAALLQSAQKEFETMAGEFGLEAEDISPYVKTIENLLRTELQDITNEISQGPVVPLPQTTTSTTSGKSSGK